MKVTRFAPWLFPFLLFPACSSRDDESHGVADDGNGNGGNGATSNGGANSGTGNVIIVSGTGGGASGGTAPTGPCMGLRCDLTTCTEGACTQPACGASDPGMQTVAIARFMSATPHGIGAASRWTCIVEASSDVALLVDAKQVAVGSAVVLSR